MQEIYITLKKNITLFEEFEILILNYMMQNYIPHMIGFNDENNSNSKLNSKYRIQVWVARKFRVHN